MTESAISIHINSKLFSYYSFYSRYWTLHSYAPMCTSGCQGPDFILPIRHASRPRHLSVILFLCMRVPEKQLVQKIGRSTYSSFFFYGSILRIRQWCFEKIAALMAFQKLKNRISLRHCVWSWGCNHQHSQGTSCTSVHMQGTHFPWVLWALPCMCTPVHGKGT